MREIFNRFGCVEERWKLYFVFMLVMFFDIKCYICGERMGIEYLLEIFWGWWKYGWISIRKCIMIGFIIVKMKLVVIFLLKGYYF